MELVLGPFSILRSGRDGPYPAAPRILCHAGEDQAIIIIDQELCKGCEICCEFCPSDVLCMSTTINSKGYYPPVVEKARECHGCRLCELLCPEFAIFIVNEWVDERAS